MINDTMPDEKNKVAWPGRAAQGVDKAPGEETSETIENFVSQTQKGKNQVDGDPEKESDQPLEHQDID